MSDANFDNSYRQPALFESGQEAPNNLDLDNEVGPHRLNKTFVENLDKCVGRIREAQIGEKEKVTAGPILKVYTSQEEELSVHYAFIGNKGYVLIATSSENIPIAVRNMDLSLQRDENSEWLRAEGTITVGRRGKSYAPALELAHLYILQEIADNLKPEQKLEWKMTNGNLIDLEKLRSQLAEYTFSDREPPGELLDAIKTKEEEQSRWQRMYGTKGLISTKQDTSSGYFYRKDFFPSARTADFNNAIEVILKRSVGEELRPEIDSVISAPSESAQGVEQINRDKFTAFTNEISA